MIVPHSEVPRIEYLKIVNYRALENIEFKNLTPFTVLLGSNGSGKSTFFDVFAFLSECFNSGLRQAWEDRRRFKELRTRGKDGPIIIELKYREKPGNELITYHIAINEDDKGVYIEEERMSWGSRRGRPKNFLFFKKGKGYITDMDLKRNKFGKVKEKLSNPDMLAVNSLGQLAKYRQVSILRKFITSWYLSYLNADATRVTTDAGPNERLSSTGNNLPNVIQYLMERRPKVYEEILAKLSSRIPKLQNVHAQILDDGRLLLRIKDAPFDKPILSKYASDGTLKMLSYLVLLYDPDPPQLIGIEEPENQLHPKLLSILVEEFGNASNRSQIFVTTHSPVFVNGLNPKELWILFRDQNGFTQTYRASDNQLIRNMIKEGAKLGDLWLENFFPMDNPFSDRR
jgi:predicted ATPase